MPIPLDVSQQEKHTSICHAPIAYTRHGEPKMDRPGERIRRVALKVTSKWRIIVLVVRGYRWKA
jgi:hypothetical protein